MSYFISTHPYFHEPMASENTDYNEITPNDKCNKLFITSLFAQLNTAGTLPSSISAVSINGS